MKHSGVDFYKFYELEQAALKELMKKKDEYEISFFKKNRKLEIKKHKLFLQKDISKWEMPSKLAVGEVQKLMES